MEALLHGPGEEGLEHLEVVVDRPRAQALTHSARHRARQGPCPRGRPGAGPGGSRRGCRKPVARLPIERGAVAATGHAKSLA